MAVLLMLMASCSKDINNNGNKIVVKKQINGTDKYESYKEIKDSKEVQNVKEILDSINWVNAAASMVNPSEFEFYFEDTRKEQNPNALIYSLWISPNKDQIELVIHSKTKYVQLSKQKSSQLFKILTSKSLEEYVAYDNLEKLPINYKWDLAVKNGDVVEVGGKIYNFEKLESFIKVFKENKAFESDMIRITDYTKEGDACINFLSYSSEGVKLITDNTRDKWSAAERRKRVEHKVVDIIQEDIFDGIGYVSITDKGKKILLFHVSNN
jgi:hypothetical protein